MRKGETLPGDILSGWKDIANYLGKGVRTVQRYERALGLPVRHPVGKAKGAVIATKAELDGWVMASPIRETFSLAPSNVENTDVLKEFRRNLRALRQLRQENAELREELHGAIALLRETVRCLPLPDHHSERRLMNRGLADLLAFDRQQKVS